MLIEEVEAPWTENDLQIEGVHGHVVLWRRPEVHRRPSGLIVPPRDLPFKVALGQMVNACGLLPVEPGAWVLFREAHAKDLDIGDKHPVLLIRAEFVIAVVPKDIEWQLIPSGKPRRGVRRRR